MAESFLNWIRKLFIQKSEAHLSVKHVPKKNKIVIASSTAHSNAARSVSSAQVNSQRPLAAVATKPTIKAPVRAQRKPQIADIDFVESLEDEITILDHKSRVMIIIAIMNLDPFLKKELKKNDYESNPDYSAILDFFITSLAKSGSMNEVQARRHRWFGIAARIKRANKLVENNPSSLKSLLTTWACLIESSNQIKHALERNIIWSEEDLEIFTPFYLEQKGEWIDPLNSDFSGMQWCLLKVVPFQFRTHSPIKELASKAALDF